MPQDIISQFDRKFNFPIETDRTVTTLTARNAIDPSTRWEGMIVYVEQDETNYFLKGGVDNADWTSFALPDNAVLHLGDYNASTNTPVLTDISGSLGQSYKIIGAATETNVDFGSGDIPLTNNDFILHDGSNWIKYINNNQSGGGSVTLLPNIVDDSTDGVQSNAIFDTITRDNFQALMNPVSVGNTFKLQDAQVDDFSTITYDRDIIFVKTVGNAGHMIVTDTLVSNALTDVLNNTGSRWKTSIFTKTNTSSGMEILQMFYSRALNVATVAFAGVPAGYTVYSFDPGSWPASSVDVSTFGDGLVNFHLLKDSGATPLTANNGGVIIDNGNLILSGNVAQDTTISPTSTNTFTVRRDGNGVGYDNIFIPLTGNRFLISNKQVSPETVFELTDTTVGISSSGAGFNASIINGAQMIGGIGSPGIIEITTTGELRINSLDIGVPVVGNVLSIKDTDGLIEQKNIESERDIKTLTTITGDGGFVSPATIQQSYEYTLVGRKYVDLATFIDLNGTTTNITVNLPAVSLLTVTATAIIDGVGYPALFSGGGSDINITGLTGVNMSNVLLSLSVNYKEGDPEE